MSLVLVVLEEKLFTRTPTPQSDDIKRPKMASVRYFGGLWMTFNEELQGQISACLQRTYICITGRQVTSGSQKIGISGVKK